VLFIAPTILAFYFSLTRWSLFGVTFIGLDNFRLFLSDQALVSSLRNTIFYAVVTSGLKVIIALPLAALLTSRIRLKTATRSIIFFPVALVDVWKGVGIALVIFIAGILAIPDEYNDAVRLDGGAWARFRYVTIPLSRNATFTVILLSFIGGLRSFDLIWTMTRGGPGFTTDVVASTIYKEYQAGFFGLSTAGNVILFLGVVVVVYPLNRYFRRKELAL
jgi:raffinose/stachyose/melibiose transport system permease protein